MTTPASNITTTCESATVVYAYTRRQNVEVFSLCILILPHSAKIVCNSSSYHWILAPGWNLLVQLDRLRVFTLL